MIDLNNKEEVANRLKELKERNLPHMTIEQFARISSYFAKDIKEATEDEKKAISEQLIPFYRAEEGPNKCLFSDEEPCLRWGLAHGTAYDEQTGLSWVCYHNFIINGKTQRYDITLQYHPDNYEIDDDMVGTRDIEEGDM